MTSSLAKKQKEGDRYKYGAIVSAGGSIASFIALSGGLMWLCGIGLLVLAGFMLKKTIQCYAESGKRF